MPYFKKNNINLLFIHIPKCGGTSIEKYFCKNFNFNYDKSVWYTVNYPYNDHSLQHTTYQEIKNDPINFVIDNNNLNIITCIRNPYTKFISALFFNNLININDFKDTNKITNILNNIITDLKKDKTIYDNHFLLQTKFLKINNKIDENIIILRNENLIDMMKNIGYSDFNYYENKNTKISEEIYYLFINENTLNILNLYYDDDFKTFNYEKLTYVELLKKQLNILNNQLQEKDNQLQQQNNQLQEKDIKIQELSKQIQQKNNNIKDLNNKNVILNNKTLLLLTKKNNILN